MSIQDFWEDHPLWIRNAIHESHTTYVVIHVLAVFFVFSIWFPATGVFLDAHAAQASGSELPGFLRFALGSVAAIIGGYALLALPIRVLGGNSMASYLCVMLTFVLLWYWV